MPLHFLHLYQKPKQGNKFLRRFVAHNYKHKISANGWFDTAQCEIRVNTSEAQQFLDQHIGNRVAIYVDNPAEPCWEGFINRMTFSGGGSQYTISLDEMVNQAQVAYTVNGAISPTTSAAVNDTNSQAIYGIKNDTVELGFQYAAGTAVTNSTNGILSQRAWPKGSSRQGSGSGLVTLELQGFWHTLAWENFRSTATGTASITGNIIPLQIMPAFGNTIFFDNTDMSAIEANALTYNVNKTRNQTFQQVLQSIAELGNATSYFIVGITPTDVMTGTRKLYYRAANTDIIYTAKHSDGLRLRNLYGRLERPWAVRPDGGVRVTDMLIGWGGQGDPPRESWVAAIDYDANTQTVTWTGDDNLTTEGIFQLNRINKGYGKGFGAAMRVI